MHPKKVLISNPYGNTFVRGLLPELENAGILSKYYTLLATNPHAPWLKFLPAKVQAEFLRRTFPIDSKKIETSAYQAVEISRKLLNEMGLIGQNYQLVEYINRNFDQSVAKKLKAQVKKDNIGSVYAYEDTALNTFKKAKLLSLKCIYDLPIAYWEYARKLQKEEVDRYPDWALTLKGGIDDPQEKLERKVQEIQLADLIVVPSMFVKNSIPEWVPRENILISPFGTPKNLPSLKTNKLTTGKNKKLRILFVGSMSQRKGLNDLFSAMKLLDTNQVELVVMGSLYAPMKFYRDEYNDFTYEPGRPHEEVLELMQTCDIFCLPSIIEGRALVMQEAMSQGLPLIITPNTGGDDLIVEGKTGFLVPIRSPEAIANKIKWFLDNRKQLHIMSELAQKKAMEYTWEGYGTKIVNAIQELIA